MSRVKDESARRTQPCRLCGGPVALSFAKQVLGQYEVGFWRCADCGSMQTDSPYWLDESYTSVHSATDTGMVARTLQMAELVSLLLKIAGVRNQALCLDWGGGNGLFCRMMRDQGYNFLNDDKYAEPFYCAGFTADRFGIAKCDIVTAFEIFEHLPNPKAELENILRFDPKLWVFSTQLYEGQGPDWNYFSPHLGRHVFFYSEKALRNFAEGHGYAFVRGRHLHMFLKRERNPYFQGRPQQMGVRAILRGGKMAGLAAGLNFLMRQRRAYRHWQSDSNIVRLLRHPSNRP